MKTRDYDKELEELKEDIRSIIGEKELNRITEIVNLSYQFDEKPKYEITHEIIE